MFFAVIIFSIVMISKKNIRTMLLGGMAIVGLLLGIIILEKYFPGSLNYLVDFDKANEYMDASYFGTETFTRNAIFEIANSKFFQGDSLRALFGFGIGTCDTSSYFTSPFYEQYGYMNYRQYGIAMTLLQNGYLGLAIYLIFFVFVFLYAIKHNYKNKTVMTAVATICIFAVMDSFYASLYIDAGYFVFFMLSLPFVLMKKSGE